MARNSTDGQVDSEGQVEGDAELEDTDAADAEQDTDGADTPEDNTAALEQAVADANTALTEATAKVQTAAAGGVLKDILDSTEALQRAKRDLDRATGQLQAATYERRNEERMAFSVELKEAVELFLADLDIARARELMLTGVTVSFEESGDPLVNINAAKPATPQTRSSTRTGNAGPRGKALVKHEGQTYTGREFIEKFGGEDGAKALHKASNYKEYGLANSPGFDAFKKALVKKLGAEIVEE